MEEKKLPKSLQQSRAVVLPWLEKLRNDPNVHFTVNQDEIIMFVSRTSKKNLPK